MSKISKGEVTAQELHAYFDDELAADQAKAVAEALAADPALQSELDALGVLRGTVPASLMAVADAVPEARFEQIWDEIDRAIERDARLQAEADRRGSVWTRLWAALSGVRVPLLAAGAAAAVTVLVVGSGPDESTEQADAGPNNPPSVASVDEDPGTAPKAPQAGGAQAEPTKVADANPGRSTNPSGSSEGDPEPTLPPMPVPENNEVEIHDIQFGAGSGSISSNGTVTVLYVEEDDEQHPSERSL